MSDVFVENAENVNSSLLTFSCSNCSSFWRLETWFCRLVILSELEFEDIMYPMNPPAKSPVTTMANSIMLKKDLFLASCTSSVFSTTERFHVISKGTFLCFPSCSLLFYFPKKTTN